MPGDDGFSLRNVTLTVRKAGKKKPVFSELGEMLFTHFGVSGPLVLSASSHMTGDLGDYSMEIDLKPGLTVQQLDARLLRDFEKYINKDFSNALDELLPRKLIPVAVQLSGIAPDTKVNQITREEREKLAAVIKAFPVTPVRFRPVEEAIVTSGGVKVSEVDPHTMESGWFRGCTLWERYWIWTPTPAATTFRSPFPPPAWRHCRWQRAR